MVKGETEADEIKVYYLELAVLGYVRQSLADVRLVLTTWKRGHILIYLVDGLFSFVRAEICC